MEISKASAAVNSHIYQPFSAVWNALSEKKKKKINNKTI
jgi:hypothetical protein